MATVQFKINTKNAFNSIFIRFKEGNKFDIEISTGLKVPNNRWSASKKCILPTTDVDYLNINQNLQGLSTEIQKKYNATLLSNDIINSRWLKKEVDLYFNRKSEDEELNIEIFFTHYIESFIKLSKTRKTRNGTLLKPRTIQHYNTTLSKIKDFEIYTGKTIKLSEVNLIFHSTFIDYLENEIILNPNTVGGYIDDIKQFCRSADLKNYQISHEYKLKEFHTPSNKTIDPYLKELEINKIFEFDFKEDYLDNARDWLIIGLRTGLRISDFLDLNKKDIIDGFIEKINLKTDYPTIIPIHDNVDQILRKRKGNFPREISDQKFNDYIKIVAEKVGLIEIIKGGKITDLEVEIDGKAKTIHRKIIGNYPKYELVSSHICRRSFATNLYGKIETLTIMKITGHSTEKQFLAYIKITPKEYAEKLKAYWKDQKNS